MLCIVTMCEIAAVCADCLRLRPAPGGHAHVVATRGVNRCVCVRGAGLADPGRLTESVAPVHMVRAN